MERSSQRRRRPQPGWRAWGDAASRGNQPFDRPQLDFLAVAERIIRASNREHPADRVLKSELRLERGLAPQDATTVSQTVFAYFRWRGWLKEAIPLRAQIKAAQGLAERYAREPSGFSDGELAAHAIPAWLPTLMETPAEWLRSLQRQPRLWLRARRGQGRELSNRLGACDVFGGGLLADTLEYRGDTDLFRTAEFHAGDFELQDISSQAVGFVCDPHPGEKWWDACAGEGGKTLHLAALMENRGLIWASDRAAWRLTALKRRAARAGVFNYRAVPWNGSSRLPTKTEFDGVLVDAPCSGLGTWHRNPHARWTTTPQDVQELRQVQTEMLVNAATAVKRGGRLIYAACTLTRAETAEVTQAFEARCPQFQRLAVSNPLKPGSSAGEFLSLWPQDTGGNGMFICAWTRAVK